MHIFNRLSKISFPNVLTALMLLFLSTQTTFAQRSDLRGQLLETSTGSPALGIGGGAFATSEFNGTAISTITAINSAALAFGYDAAARLGGIELKSDSEISGTLTDTTTVTNSGGLSFAGCDDFSSRPAVNNVGGVASGSVIGQGVGLNGWAGGSGRSGRVQMRCWHFLSWVIGGARWPGVRRERSLLAAKSAPRTPDDIGVISEMVNKRSGVLALAAGAGIGGISISNAQFNGAATSLVAPVNSVALGSIRGAATVCIGGIVIR
jgi:hypothetical protein